MTSVEGEAALHCTSLEFQPVFKSTVRFLAGVSVMADSVVAGALMESAEALSFVRDHLQYGLGQAA